MQVSITVYNLQTVKIKFALISVASFREASFGESNFRFSSIFFVLLMAHSGGTPSVMDNSSYYGQDELGKWFIVV